MNCEIYKEEAANLKEKLISHPIFTKINDQHSLKIFMQNHIFAVWDFMSLVKRLQNSFSCNSVPWMPPKNREACRLINEINLGEECDDCLAGGTASHFEMYLEAMEEMGADTDMIKQFIRLQYDDCSLDDTLGWVKAPAHIKKFVSYTIDVAKNGSIYQVMGCFFNGREDIIPQMFTRLLNDWGIDKSEAPALVYYLDRHIELDSDTHGPAAQRIIDGLLKHSPEEEINYLNAAIESLQQRIELWDSIYESIFHVPLGDESQVYVTTG